MPILDCENYSLEAMALGPMQHLAGQLRISGGDPDRQPLSYVNIYFGMQQLRTPSALPWYVCVSRPYGFLTVLFHFVRHGDVVKTSLVELDDSRGLCITLMWTSNRDLAAELIDGLRAADNMIRQIEMLKGVPLPLPLKPQQLPDRFAVRTITPNSDNEHEAVVNSVLIPDENHGVVVDERTALAVGAMAEALGPIEDIITTPMERAIHLSSTWQQHAIRALGMEEWPHAIVASNTWIETFLVQLAMHMNDVAGTPIQEVPQAIMKSGLPRFINTHLGQNFLKGRWDHTDQTSAFGRWYEKCFSIRNQVVHGGHFSTETEAKQAYDAAHELAFLVTDRAARINDKRFDELLKPLRLMNKLRKTRTAK